MNDNSIVKVFDGEELVAIIIKKQFEKKVIEFFTPNDYSQQLAYMSRPAGYKIKAHIHNKVQREVNMTQEVLFIRTGAVRVDFYDQNKSVFRSEVLMPGDIILLASGGHGFSMLESTEMIEVKQGPYAGEADKTYLEN